MEQTINEIENEKTSIKNNCIETQFDKRNIVKSIANLIIENQLSINEAGEILSATMQYLKNIKINPCSTNS